MSTIANPYSPAQANEPMTLAQETGQYSLGKILGIWAIVTLPMVLLTWVVAPAIIPYSPLHPGITFWLLMILGMAWEFVVALAILYRELGTLRGVLFANVSGCRPRGIPSRTSPMQGFTGCCCLS